MPWLPRGGVSVYDLDTGWPLRQLPVGNVAALAFTRTTVAWQLPVVPSCRFLIATPGLNRNGYDPSKQRSHRLHRMAPGRPPPRGRQHQPDPRFDADSATEIPSPSVDRANVDTIVFNHSGDRLLSWDWSMQTLLWNPTSREPLLASPYELHPNATFSPDDRLVGFSRVSRSDGGKIRVWRVASGRELLVLDNPGNRMEMLQAGSWTLPAASCGGVGDGHALVLLRHCDRREPGDGPRTRQLRPAFCIRPRCRRVVNRRHPRRAAWPLRSIPGGADRSGWARRKSLFDAATEGAGSGNEGAATAPADARSQLPGTGSPARPNFYPWCAATTRLGNRRLPLGDPAPQGRPRARDLGRHVDTSD